MEKKPIKVVTIGGGSSYTPELMEGFIKRYDELPIREIWLVDIEDGKEKLEIVGAMAQRMWDATPYNVKVHLTLDRREALPGADFVTTQFRVGLLNARIKDERIPLSNGMQGQETNGAGGMFKAFRTIPVILDIVKDMKEKTQLIVMRILIAFFIILSVVIALNPPTFIAQLMGISWGALAGAFLAPFMYGLYSKKVTRASVWASFIVGVGLTVSNMFFQFIASPINAGAIAMVASLIVVPIVSLITPKMKKEHVDEIFTCYDQRVTVTEKTSLGE